MKLWEECSEIGKDGCGTKARCSEEDGQAMLSFPLVRGRRYLWELGLYLSTSYHGIHVWDCIASAARRNGHSRQERRCPLRPGGASASVPCANRLFSSGEALP